MPTGARKLFADVSSYCEGSGLPARCKLTILRSNLLPMEWYWNPN